MRFFFLVAYGCLFFLVHSCFQANLCETGNCTPVTYTSPELLIDFNEGAILSGKTMLFNEDDDIGQFLSTSLHQEEMKLASETLTRVTSGMVDQVEGLPVSAVSYFTSAEAFSNTGQVQVNKKNVLGYAIHYYDASKKMYFLVSKNFQNGSCSTERTVSNISMNHIWEISSCINGGLDGNVVFLKEKATSEQRPTRINSTVPRSLGFTGYDKVVPTGGPEPSYCTKPCLSNDKGDECFPEYDADTDSEYYVCVRGACLVVSTEDTVKYYPDLEREPLLFARLYTFRDSYLAGKTKGQNYISKYYFLSEVTSITDFSFSSLYNVTSISPEILTKMDKLVAYNEGDLSLGSDILYDDEFGQKVTTALDDLMNDLPAGSESKAVLSSVKSDVALYQNKTIAEIDNLISL